MRSKIFILPRILESTPFLLDTIHHQIFPFARPRASSFKKTRLAVTTFQHFGEKISFITLFLQKSKRKTHAQGHRTIKIPFV